MLRLTILFSSNSCPLVSAPIDDSCLTQLLLRYTVVVPLFLACARVCVCVSWLSTCKAELSLFKFPSVWIHRSSFYAVGYNP